MPDNRYLHKIEKPLLPFATLSHRGRVRHNNEDRLAVQCFITDEKEPRTVLLAALSDGVGGHRSGEIAAQIGITAIQEYFEELTSLENPAGALCDALVAANLAVQNAGAANPDLAGMGATCICGLIVERTFFLAYLGDSRAYLLRGRLIRQLSYDHTVLEEVLRFTPPGKRSQSRNHPLAHVLSRYLGSAHPAEVDTRIRSKTSRLRQKPPDPQNLDLRSGDRILLCSDGLTDMLTDSEILSAIQGRALNKDVQRLVLGALDKGGHDNVSVILVEII